MALYERLIGGNAAEGGQPQISVHQFFGSIGEWERGKLTPQQIIAAYGLSVPEQAEVATLLTRIVTPLETISIGSFVTLTNVGATYDAIAASQGLGIARVQLAGISGFDFTVLTNKIGSGTQSWQLWNQTDGTEVAVINDAGATGIKELNIVVPIDPPLTTNAYKTVRVRAKSTTAADDPVFLGAALTLRRAGRMTSFETHEIFLQAAEGIPPYDGTLPMSERVAAVKARLGVV